VLAITPGLAAAGGFYAQELSVKGAGRAYSGEAADVGADSQWWNPAAIARSGNELTLGAHGRFNSDTLRDEGSTVVYPGGATVPVGGESVIEDVTQDDVVPNGAFSVGVGDRLAAGVSVTPGRSCLDTHLSPTFWGRYDTIHAHVKTTDIQGTVAAQVNSWLDVGRGRERPLHRGDARERDAEPFAAAPGRPVEPERRGLELRLERGGAGPHRAASPWAPATAPRSPMSWTRASA
jgi:long-chain fatty acid transport protein